MFEIAFAQIRFAASLLFGWPFDVGSLERLVEAAKATRREHGTLGHDSAELISGPTLDERDRLAMQMRRFRQQAIRAARETEYYHDLFRRTGFSPALLTEEDLVRLPITPKADLRDRPDAFVSRRASVALRTTTTGTTGRPTAVSFSEYELRVSYALRAFRQLFDGSVTERDIIQISTSARATLGNSCAMVACARVGATVSPVGLIDPETTLALLAEPRAIPGKAPKVTILLTYSSYLGELVEQARRLGYQPSDFGLEQIMVGGEVVTEGLKARAQDVFGPVSFEEGYAMTETWPLGGARCSEGHLHFEPSQGLVEVIDPETGRPAAPGAVGTIVATPLPPYRETTLLLRYDTEDLVRVLDGPPTCEYRHLPATSNLLGKRRLAARHAGGWSTPMDVLEALESLDSVPLPARCGFWSLGDGVAVEVLVREAGAGVHAAVLAALEARSVPVRQLRLVERPAELTRPLPLRADLREAAFASSRPSDVHASVVVGLAS